MDVMLHLCMALAWLLKYFTVSVIVCFTMLEKKPQRFKE